MIRKVLIVEDDLVFQRLVKKLFEKYQNAFSILTATHGEEAIKMLKENTVSIIVTDLQMPVMDGFALLAHISEHFMDIPTIIMTGTKISKSMQGFLENSYAGFIQKPLVFKDLLRKIVVALKEQREGGVLKTFSLETFVQLVEMEQKTCTIRAFNKSKDNQGVLFFKKGKLLDARVKDLYGKPAALEIFFWENITLTIQDTCVLKSKRISDPLQTVLMDAMRKKDEALEGDQSQPKDPKEVKINSKINEADAFRIHGLYEEALAVYKEILADTTGMNPKFKKMIKKKVETYRKQIEEKIGQGTTSAE